MAYTNTPKEKAYRTIRFDFASTPLGRNGLSTTQDQRFVNIFPEKIDDKTNDEPRWVMRQRPGTLFDFAVPAGAARGCAWFNGHLYSAVGNKLYRGTSEIATLSNSSGRVGFTQYNGVETSLIAVDGINGFIIKTDNSVSKIVPDVFVPSASYALGQRVSAGNNNGMSYVVTVAGTAGGAPTWPSEDAKTVTTGGVTFLSQYCDFPTPHLPYPAFIDGYLVLVKSDTDDMYNSDLEDPTVWTPGSFLTSELYPDKIKCLTKMSNYLVALGETTIEMFFDAGIASGSPFQRNDSAVQQMGTTAPDTVVSSDGEVLYVGTTGNGGMTVWKLRGFETEEIGSPMIRQHLTTQAANLPQAFAFTVRTNGRKFYVLSTTTRTFVYDLESKCWHEWTTGNSTTPFFGKYSCDHPDGYPRVQHPTNGSILALHDTTAHEYTASGTYTTMYVELVTDKMDFGSNNRKTCGRISVLGYIPDGGSNLPMHIAWSDDDYRSWTSARDVNLAADLPALTQLGTFRRRAWKFAYQQPYPLRLDGFEVDINIGTR